jgi:16S rRNA G1207 methylase RsmC
MAAMSDSRTEQAKLREDIVFRATLLGHPMVFHTTWGLFSPKAIDEGTQMLVERVELEPDNDCLDLGCGYGALGLSLAKSAPKGHTTLVDKDFVAVDYSRLNARLNHVDNAEVVLSNGFSAIKDRRFDVVASNLPAKVGNELMSIFITDALHQLNAGGRVYVVTITGLRRYIERTFKEVFGNYKKLKQGKHYTVAMAEKS